MADKNINSISDEELKEVNGGGRVGGAGRACTRSINRDRFVEEAKKRINPNDPLSWFQTVVDLFGERGGIK